MTDIKKFVGCLALLIAADIVLTAVAAGYMGAAVLNPLCELCGGVDVFLTVKAVVSVAGMVGLLWLGRARPKEAKTMIGLLCVVYAVVVVWEVGTIMGEII